MKYAVRPPINREYAWWPSEFVAAWWPSEFVAAWWQLRRVHRARQRGEEFDRMMADLGRVRVLVSKHNGNVLARHTRIGGKRVT